MFFSRAYFTICVLLSGVFYGLVGPAATGRTQVHAKHTVSFACKLACFSVAVGGKSGADLVRDDSIVLWNGVTKRRTASGCLGRAERIFSAMGCATQTAGDFCILNFWSIQKSTILNAQPLNYNEGLTQRDDDDLMWHAADG